jgi:hypothetical protein
MGVGASVLSQSLPTDPRRLSCRRRFQRPSPNTVHLTSSPPRVSCEHEEGAQWVGCLRHCHPGFVSASISLGVIARAVPLEAVRQVLAQSGRASERERDLAAHVMVYCVIALAL